MDIAKITKEEEFIKVLEAYKPLATDPQASVSTKDELKTKLQNFIRKHLIALNKKQQKGKEELPKLVEFLLLVDRELPWEDFFNHHGEELFSVVFKLTFYDHDYAVNNNRAFPLAKEDEEMKGEEEKEVLDLKILEHSQLLEHITTRIQHEEAKSNFVVNNLLSKMLQVIDKQEMLRLTAEVLYSQDTNFSTRRTAKILAYFGTLFKQVTQRRSSFYMGSLFALGGLLKLEAKSYLKTLSQRREKFELACPLVNPESDMEKQEEQKLRIMEEADLHYFEHDFITVVLHFIQTIIEPVKGQLTGEVFQFYVEFSQPQFIDELDEVKEKEPEKLERVETLHYVLCFLFDMLQFSFQYMILAKEVPNGKGDEEQKEERKKFFDHRKPLQGPELALFDYHYYFPRFEELILVVLNGLKEVNVGDRLRYLWFWHMKNSEEEKKWDEDDEGKDCYDRQDNYNVFGLAVYLYLLCKPTTLHLTGTSIKSSTLDICNVLGFGYCPIGHAFLFDQMTPFLSYSLKSKSGTLVNMGVEAVQMWTYLLQGRSQFAQLGEYSRDEKSVQFVLQYLYQFLGSQNCSASLSLSGTKSLYQLLLVFEGEARLRIFQYLYAILEDDKNDRAIGILTSQFYKDSCDRDGAVFIKGAKEVITETLDQQKTENAYILDYTERIGASLNLYMYLHQKESLMLQREKSLLVEWWGEENHQQVTNPAFKKELKDKYLDPLLHIIEGGFATVEEDMKQLESSQQDESIKKNMAEQIEARKGQLALLRFNLEQALQL